MAGEASASIAADVLEERIAGGTRDAARLVGRDAPVGVIIDIEFWNDLRRLLGSSGGVLQNRHLQGMIDGPGRPIPHFSLVEGVGILRDAGSGENIQETDVPRHSRLTVRVP